MDESGLEFKIRLSEDIPQTQNQPTTDTYQSQHINEPESKQQMGSQQNGQQNQASTLQSSNYDLNKASHPKACIFTFIFKLLALITYLFLNIISSNRITVFIIVIIFTAFDFWTVKNVTGRLLVGLRWLSDYQDDGTEIWSYESHENQREPNKVDSAFFWSSQVIAVVIWGLFVLVNVLSLNIYWTCLDIIVLTLSATNFYGFYKCRGEHQKKMAGMKNDIAQKGLSYLGNMMFQQKFGA